MSNSRRLKEKAQELLQQLQERRPEPLDPELREKALELLRDPAFFYKLGFVMERGFKVPKLNKVRFVIGEERNKRLLPLLIGASAKMKLTNIIRYIGEIGTGKDSLIRLSLALCEGGVSHVERGYLTGGGLRYSRSIKEADILYIPDSPELRGETGRQLRLMRADDGGLVYEYAYQDPKTWRMETVEEKVPVKMIVTSSNEVRVDPALESGAWTLQSDSSEELTLRVQREKLKFRAGRRPTFPEDELEVWKAAFQIALTEEIPGEILIPYAESLICLMSAEQTEQRRSPDKLCDLIETIAFWRRFQKPLEKRCEADLADLYIALQLGLDALTKTLAPLDDKEQFILNIVKEAGVDELATVRYVAEKTRMGYKTAYKYLERLVDKGYLAKDKSGNKNFYVPIQRNIEGNLLLTSIRSFEAVTQLMEQILSSDENFSTSTLPPTTFIDPVTGDEITLELNEGQVSFSRRNRSYDEPYRPLEEDIGVAYQRRSSETSEIMPPLDELNSQKLLGEVDISYKAPIHEKKKEISHAELYARLKETITHLQRDVFLKKISFDLLHRYYFPDIPAEKLQRCIDAAVRDGWLIRFFDGSVSLKR